MTPAEEEFVERVGRHFQADGMPRIGGRLYAFLLLRDQPRSLDELAEALHVSKASVSTNARFLGQQGLIRRVTRPGDRRDFYGPAAEMAGVLELRLERVREYPRPRPPDGADRSGAGPGHRPGRSRRRRPSAGATRPGTAWSASR